MTDSVMIPFVCSSDRNASQNYNVNHVQFLTLCTLEPSNKSVAVKRPDEAADGNECSPLSIASKAYAKKPSQTKISTIVFFSLLALGALGLALCLGLLVLVLAR